MEPTLFFLEHEQALLSPSIRKIITDRDGIVHESGVYAAFYQGSLIYVGETRNLHTRLAKHLRNPENHVLTLKIARLLSPTPSPTSVKKFSKEHIKLTLAWIETELEFSYLPVALGRKELEEFLIGKYDPEFNKRYPTLIL